MKKIGLIIKNTRQGEEVICQFNARNNTDRKLEQWASGLPDARNYVKQISDFDSSGKTVYVIKFLGEAGIVVGIIKTGHGRAGDNITAWIHVPADIDMAKLKISEIIQAIETQFSSAEGLNEKDLEKYFTPDYPTKNNLINKPLLCGITSKAEGKYAYCYYNTREELQYLFTNIAQKSYGEYQALFFINKIDGLDVPNGKRIPLSNTNAICTVFHPQSPDQYGFKPMIVVDGKRTPFDKEYEAYAGEQLAVIWEKPHHESITDNYNVTADNNSKPATPDDKPHYYLLTKDDIKVSAKGENNNIYDKCTIKINDRAFYPERGEKFHLENASGTLKVRVKVACKGFKDYEQEHTINTKASNASISIQMERLDRVYKFEIPIEFTTRNGKKKDKKSGYATFTYNTKSIIEECPIKGYKAQYEISEKDPNTLEYKHLEWLKWSLIGFAAGVVVSAALLFFGLIPDTLMPKDDSGKVPPTEQINNYYQSQQQSQQPVQQQVQQPAQPVEQQVDSVPTNTTGQQTEQQNN